MELIGLRNPNRPSSTVRGGSGPVRCLIGPTPACFAAPYRGSGHSEGPARKERRRMQGRRYS
jgi:hypothetical protein